MGTAVSHNHDLDWQTERGSDRSPVIAASGGPRLGRLHDGGFMGSFERKFVVFGTIGVISFFAFFIMVNRILGEITQTFYWGLPLGVGFGIATCFFSC